MCPNSENKAPNKCTTQLKTALTHSPIIVNHAPIRPDRRARPKKPIARRIIAAVVHPTQSKKVYGPVGFLLLLVASSSTGSSGPFSRSRSSGFGVVSGLLLRLEVSLEEEDRWLVGVRQEVLSVSEASSVAMSVVGMDP